VTVEADQHDAHDTNGRVNERATLMITVLSVVGVLLFATAILCMRALTGRDDDDLWLLPVGYPGQPADREDTPAWVVLSWHGEAESP